MQWASFYHTTSKGVVHAARKAGSGRSRLRPGPRPRVRRANRDPRGPDPGEDGTRSRDQDQACGTNRTSRTVV